jgi:response regulator RpfG family c-di-GMP phosphodiesterase
MCNNKHRILIIDGNKVTVSGLKAYLGKKYHVLTAHSGLDGIQKFEKNKNRVHLVLTGLIFLDTIGSYLVSMIKKMAPEKPIIAMTGWVHYPEEFEPKTNADLILKKPFEMEELDQAIEKLLPGIHIKKIRPMATPKKKKRQTQAQLLDLWPGP